MPGNISLHVLHFEAGCQTNSKIKFVYLEQGLYVGKYIVNPVNYFMPLLWYSPYGNTSYAGGNLYMISLWEIEYLQNDLHHTLYIHR